MSTCSKCELEVESMVELAEHLLLSHDGEKQIRKEPTRWFDTFMNVWRVQFDCLVCEREASYKEGGTPTEFCYSCEKAVKYGESREQDRICDLIEVRRQYSIGSRKARQVDVLLPEVRYERLIALIKGEGEGN